MSWTDFLSYGLLGLVVMMFLLGFIWPKPAVDKLLWDLQRAERERDRLLQEYQDRERMAFSDPPGAAMLYVPYKELAEIPVAQEPTEDELAVLQAWASADLDL